MKRRIWIVVLWVACLPLWGQYDPAFTNSWALQSYHNPAAAGVDGHLNVQGAYSLQMAGYEGAPKTMIITADLPLTMLPGKHAVGAGFMNDAIGFFSHKKIYVQYAYHFPIGWQKQGKLSFGARAVILQESFDGSKVETEVSGDKAFPTSQVNGFKIDADFGVRFTWKNVWYAGLSAMHLTSPTVYLGDTKANEISIPMMFHLNGGYKLFFRDPRFMLDTHAILRTDFSSWRGDVTARLAYEGPKTKLYGGILYSPLYSVGLLFGFDLHGVNIGYSYELYTGGVGLKNGTHEIMLGYQFDMDKKKKGKNLHKSIRFL